MIDILYEDKSLLVVKKPAGLPVQTAKIGQQDMVSMLKNYRAMKKEEPYIGVIHRLDQPVEGVMVFARTKQAAAELSSQAAGRSGHQKAGESAVQMDKIYLAAVYLERPDGLPDEGMLTDYLLRDGRSNTSKVVSKETPGAKKAVLHYQIIQKKNNFAELLIRLETGRHHQIRVQMANAGCPLVGDLKYGNASCRNVAGAGKNVALCSVKLSFVHPLTKKQMEFSIEPENKTFFLFKDS